MSARVFAAVDIGASGGRVMAGVVEGDAVTLRTAHRFGNRARFLDGHLRWDLDGLFREVMAGLSVLASEFPHVESIGIDTWGVDYGLLDADGHLLAPPIAYRDDRTGGVVHAVHQRVSPDELYRITGVQFLSFNTIYQLAAEQRGPLWDKVAHVVLLPDLFAAFLTGELRSEATNASTTALVDVRTGEWSRELLARLDIPFERLPPIEPPGTVRGPLKPELATRLRLSPSTVITTVGSHDTASAVVGIPATTPHFAYVSSGTWSLVGLELDEPILTVGAQAENFTNERGVDGRVRFLRNVGGLWLLQESLRTWAEQGTPFDLGELLADAAALPERGLRIDVDDPAFLAPGDLPVRIAEAVAARGDEPPRTPAEFARCIVDSLADAYARRVEQAARLAGRRVDVIHLVGGGSQNELLCRRTAAASGCPVVAGPTEATALGNVLVQARAHGAAPESLEELRALVGRSTALRRYEPD